jgi:hypothetical protein
VALFSYHNLLCDLDLTTFYAPEIEEHIVLSLFHFFDIYPPLSKKGGHIALLLSAVGSVGPSAFSVHFLGTGCTY